MIIDEPSEDGSDGIDLFRRPPNEDRALVAQVLSLTEAVRPYGRTVGIDQLAAHAIG
ncbi:hypothetical protein D3C85_1696400 [compost metagenome]